MTPSEQKIQQIHDGAMVVFSRYGLRKTTMLDIAEAAGISRAALYLCFKNKEDIFRSLSAHLHAQALANARDALQAPGERLANLENALCGFAFALLAPLEASPHGQELFDANMALAADISLQAKAELRGDVEQVLAQACEQGEIAFSAHRTSASALAAMILAALDGFKHAEAAAETLPDRLALLIGVLRSGLRPSQG